MTPELFASLFFGCGIISFMMGFYIGYWVAK